MPSNRRIIFLLLYLQKKSSMPTYSRRLLVALSLLLITGCQTEAPPGKPDAAAHTETGDLLPETENWGTLLINGKKIGYQHFKRTHVKTDDGLRVRVESTAEIRIRRFGSETLMRMQQIATETADGQLIDFETQLKSGATTQKTTGEVRDGKLYIQQAARPATALPLPNGGGSFAAVEHSLERAPLKPGETRTVQQIEPTLGGVVAVALTAKDWESTELLSGSFRLLRIDGQMNMPGGVSLPLVAWTDKNGNVLKHVSSLGDLKQTAYRTSKDIALAPVSGAQFDLGRATTVPLKRGVAGMHAKQKARYRVTLKTDGDGSEFASGSAQSVKKIDARTLEITVLAARPGDGSPKSIDEKKPTDAELAPNALIESDDAAVIQMANLAAGDATDTWAIAQNLERHVYRAIRKKNFSSAFDSAATVADTLAGDCTEHAVLLAALARAKKIPARVAVGLVYMSGSNALGMHMWTEVWIDDRWIGLDATLGRGGLGPGHIKISHTALAGPAAYSSLLPVAHLLGQLEIEVMEVE
jgi:hypothetical protein